MEDTFTTTVETLEPSSSYSFAIAAMNNAGVGEYTSPITGTTKESVLNAQKDATSSNKPPSIEPEELGTEYSNYSHFPPKLNCFYLHQVTFALRQALSVTLSGNLMSISKERRLKK